MYSIISKPLLNFIFLLCLFIQLTSCSQNDKAENRKTIQGRQVAFPDTSQVSKLDGQALAAVYCQNCHAFPEPSLLPKAIWQKQVLPNMALRLGVSGVTSDPYASLSNEEIQHTVNNHVYSLQPLITLQAWKKIEAYYLSQAPETPLPQASKIPVTDSLPEFVQWIPASSHLPPLTTVIKYDSSTQSLFVGNRRKNLYRLNNHLEITDSLNLPSTPADLLVNENKLSVLTMGVMDPSDEYKGQLLKKTLQSSKTDTVLANLPRPVHISIADINTDGKKDWIISGFGNQTGRLSWFEQQSNNQIIEHVLKPVPGVSKTVVHDFNQDGLPDIMALLAQGDEQLCIFYNKGRGRFREETVLRFPPVYGSSYFELADFNQDGALDILYTNGDNADYSFSLKKYHGVRVFLNDGNNSFRQHWFFSMHGASKAITRDFDKDGDLDIAAIAFFPDFEATPHEGFIYFKNAGNMDFEPYAPLVAQQGRWLVMDAGDVDRDGDEDILLGSFVFSPTPTPQKLLLAWQNSPPCIILKNKLVESQTTSARNIQ